MHELSKEIARETRLTRFSLFSVKEYPREYIPMHKKKVSSVHK